MAGARIDVHWLCAAMLASAASAVPAQEEIGAASRWDVEPRLGARLVFSDNIDQDSKGSEVDEAVGVLTPGVRLGRQGRRTQVSIDWQADVVGHADQTDKDRVFHRLTANSTSEVVRDNLFIDLRASARQQIIDAEGESGADFLSSPSSFADVVSYGAGARLQGEFADVAVFELRASHDEFDYENNASDSTVDAARLSLRSGRSSQRLGWGLTASGSRTDREQGEDSERASAQIDLSWRVTDGFSLLARAGEEDNEVPGAAAVDGSYWSAGFSWQVNRRLSLTAFEGDRDREATLRWTPTPRTNLVSSYRDREVGIDIGPIRTLDLTHRARSSTWSLGYVEETTNQQLIQLAGQQAFVLVDASGAPILDPGTGLPIIIFQNVFSITDEEFFRERLSFTVNKTSRKSSLTLGLFDEDRRFRVSAERESIMGTSVTFARQYRPRARWRISLSGQESEFSSGTVDELVTLEVGVGGETAADVTLDFAYRYQEVDSNVVANEYAENRVTIQANLQF